jgi:hypothetical protein
MKPTYEKTQPRSVKSESCPAGIKMEKAAGYCLALETLSASMGDDNATVTATAML